MAKTKTSTGKKKTAAKKTNTAAKPKKQAPSVQMTPPPEPPQPIRRELAGLVFVLLAAFVVISLFNTDGAVQLDAEYETDGMKQKFVIRMEAVNAE